MRLTTCVQNWQKTLTSIIQENPMPFSCWFHVHCNSQPLVTFVYVPPGASSPSNSPQSELVHLNANFKCLTTFFFFPSKWLILIALEIWSFPWKKVLWCRPLQNSDFDIMEFYPQRRLLFIEELRFMSCNVLMMGKGIDDFTIRIQPSSIKV